MYTIKKQCLTPTFRNKSPTMFNADIRADGVKGVPLLVLLLLVMPGVCGTWEKSLERKKKNIVFILNTIYYTETRK